MWEKNYKQAKRAQCAANACLLTPPVCWLEPRRWHARGWRLACAAPPLGSMLLRTWAERWLRYPATSAACTTRPFFFIFIFKKIKISKIYCRSKKFQKWAPVAHGEGDRHPVAQAGGDMPFYKKKFTNRSSISAARGLGGGGSPPPKRTTGGHVATPLGRQGPLLYISPPPPFPPHLSPKIPPKIQKKKRGTSTKNPEKKERGEEKGSGEALPDYALVISR